MNTVCGSLVPVWTDPGRTERRGGRRLRTIAHDPMVPSQSRAAVARAGFHCAYPAEIIPVRCFSGYAIPSLHHCRRSLGQSTVGGPHAIQRVTLLETRLRDMARHAPVHAGVETAN